MCFNLDPTCQVPVTWSTKRVKNLSIYLSGTAVSFYLRWFSTSWFVYQMSMTERLGRHGGVSGGRGGGGRCLEWRRPMTPHPTPKSAAAATTATLSAAINQILGVNTNTPKASGLRFVPTAERLHKDPPPSPTTRILPLSPTEPTGTKPSKPKRIPIVNPNPSRVKTLGLDWL